MFLILETLPLSSGIRLCFVELCVVFGHVYCHFMYINSVVYAELPTPSHQTYISFKLSISHTRTQRYIYS